MQPVTEQLHLHGTQQDFTSTLDGGILWDFLNSDTDAATPTTFIKLSHNDVTDGDVVYLHLVADADGTPSDMFKVTQLQTEIGNLAVFSAGATFDGSNLDMSGNNITNRRNCSCCDRGLRRNRMECTT